MRHLSTVIAILALLVLGQIPPPAFAQAKFEIVYTDPPNQGFNDPTPVAPALGNPFGTLGQQRKFALLEATLDWGKAILDDAVPILVEARMEPLPGECTSHSGVIARGGPKAVLMNFPNVPLPSTWYPIALANALAGQDLAPGLNDIVVRFNIDVGTPNCLSSAQWWYGVLTQTPKGQISFFQAALHELAHGLGFLTLADSETGQLLNGYSDVYGANLGIYKFIDWGSTTNAERKFMATSNTLVWAGPKANECALQVLRAGRAANLITMYSPPTLQLGSSVNHFNTTFVPDELMEPQKTLTYAKEIAASLLGDLGWSISPQRCQRGVLTTNYCSHYHLWGASATTETTYWTAPHRCDHTEDETTKYNFCRHNHQYGLNATTFITGKPNVMDFCTSTDTTVDVRVPETIFNDHYHDNAGTPTTEPKILAGNAQN